MNIFQGPEFKPMHDASEREASDVDATKVYKIRYSINLLPQIGEYVDEQGEIVNSDENLMRTLA